MSRSRWGQEPTSVDHEHHSVIQQPQALKLKAVTGGSSRDVEKMLADAESSLAALRQEFPAWMAAELADLEKTYAYYKTGAVDGPKQLFRKVHDMRGQASTFGFPLAGRAADNLCKLMDALHSVPEDVIETHLHTVRIIVRENINIEDHPIAQQMVIGLEKLGFGLIKKALAAEAAAKSG